MRPDMGRRRGHTVLCVMGTRPEAIKMAPVIHVLRQAPWANCRVLVTAQHRELLDGVLAFFDVSPDVDLNVMRSNQTLVDLTARLLLGLDVALAAETPDMVLAQGDTTTVLAVALTSYYRRIPFGHVEAGLRTHQLSAPFPEEANRVLAGHLASLHFAPTMTARANLLAEGLPAESIHVTGNTVIDALFMAVERGAPVGVALDPTKRLVLVTAHRRDSFGAPLRGICRAVGRLSRRYADVEFLWPVHPNPAVLATVHELLAGVPGVHLCAPLSYGSFVTALKRCHLVLTDSGGVAEEAPALGKPVLVLRDESERLEAVHAGVARLVGLHEETIVAATSRLLDDPQEYARMSVGASPFGDGRAAARIVEGIRRFFRQAVKEEHGDGPKPWLPKRAA
jgi:UDP-N-acetylglucosamine 2-epimerase (non-hydrolysing)